MGMYVFGWKLGTLESIAVTIVVGFTVDFDVHIAVAYEESQMETREERTKEALVDLGISVTSAAITTAGSCIFLFFCYALPFQKLGLFVLVSIVCSLLFTMCWLTSVLTLIGPMGEQGTLKACGSSCFRKNKTR